MGPCCCACSSCQPLTLAFKGGGELPACRCALAAASPVLRDALSLETKQQGTLVLQSEVDDPAAWEVVLGMIRRDSFACELVTWDNVEQLLHVGDMYDMAVVRGYCVTFLTIHIPSLGLEVPLPSPKNLLRAATLVLKYGSLPDMTTCRTIVLSALQRALSPLSDAQSEAVLTCSGNHPAWSSKQLTPKYHCAYCKMDRERGASVPEKAKAAMRALQLVQRLVGQPDFHNVVSAEVQVHVIAALTKGLERCL